MRVIVADMYFHKKHKKLNLKLIREISTIASILLINKIGYYSQEDLSNYKCLNIFHYLPNKFDKLRNVCILLHLIILSITIRLKGIEYDKILFLATNNICCNYALLLRLFKKNSIIVIHHYDIDRTIDSKKETILFKKRMHQYNHIVFAPFIKEGMQKYLGTNEKYIHVVPHPLFVSENNVIPNTSREHLIIGIGRNNDITFLQDLKKVDLKSDCKHKNFIKMRTNGESYLGINLEIFYARDISQEQFDDILYSAKACVVIYNDSYRYRYSGVIVDALSHGCIVICNDIPIGLYYKTICPNNCKVIKSAQELYDLANIELPVFDEEEFYQYLAENSNAVIREKLYDILYK